MLVSMIQDLLSGYCETPSPTINMRDRGQVGRSKMC
jgi:hypothetical protein